MKCPSCSAHPSPSDRFCRSCGTPLGSPSELATGIAEAGHPLAAPLVGAPAVGRLLSSGSVPLGGFAPGNVLAGRYRIIGLLGRGGMGEVYRADDLKLGQPVALKFLPKELAEDPVRCERFFAEVRIARQVSHPNICRVYDIGEMEGRHFLTMEFVDGEDLASLLKRIGSLHGAKALDVARQLCAGLAAAHDKGVLHRDLKPANVMLDGRGRVRITDFGLAVAAGEDAAVTDMSGTPGYMAPEQFAGKGASVRSDIYALGLVLYEIYTGRRAFQAATLVDLRLAKEAGTPTAPSEIVRDLDPIIERVILRCLEKDPRQRPASVAHVAAALPGGDPLAAAIAAGETPSPEMVAAAGATEGLRPWFAWLLFGLTVTALAVAGFGSRAAYLLEQVPITKEPAVMQQMARDILRSAGYVEAPADSVWSFRLLGYVEWSQRRDRSMTQWNGPPDSIISFWYRQSPRPIVSWTFPGILTDTDPVPLYSGEATVVLDSQGHLTDLGVVPPPRDESRQQGGGVDWSTLFQRAGLDVAKWTPADPQRIPPSYADARAAWTGTLPYGPRETARVEAAAYNGRPVAWHIIAPWAAPAQPYTATLPAPAIVGLLLLLILIVGVVLFARRNLRMGRGDRRGATRLAYATVVLLTGSWLLETHHVADIGEIYLLLMGASLTILSAAFVWLLYVALEPHVRRRWPNTLIAWSRLLAGNIRDPLVGRDVLIGCLWVGALDTLIPLQRLAFGDVQTPPGLPILTGARDVLGLLADATFSGVTFATAALFLLLVFRVLLRREWAAVVLVFLIVAGLFLVAPNSSPPLGKLVTTLYFTSASVMLIRFGLLACATGVTLQAGLNALPISMHLDAWYAGYGLLGFALILALVGYAFYTSLGGQPLFGRLMVDD